MTNGDGASGFAACAVELATAPDLVRRILAAHGPDPDGWCRAHDAHRERHPCSIRRLAELAGDATEHPG